MNGQINLIFLWISEMEMIKGDDLSGFSVISISN